MTFAAASNQLAIKPGANKYTITASNPASNRTYTLPDAGCNSNFV
jgi:hypothetical protein